jgi:type I site-specific restriction endonuclease
MISCKRGIAARHLTTGIMLSFASILVKPSENNSEWLTRKRLINPKLKAAGWNIASFSPRKSLSAYSGCAIEEFETANGPADYALCVDDRIVGIVEAKKLTLGPQSVLTQAERFCRGITDSPFNRRGFRVPFLYSTNSEVLWYLPQSILAKGFRGELVPTEAERARREGREYEPASVLLERIMK